MSHHDHPVVAALIERSNALGADPAVTNFGGGNTSAKAATRDPIGGGDVDVMWVKGSGGDLGTLTADGLSSLRLERVNALKDVYEGPEHEDEMHQLLDLCVLTPGAAPSIDTSMHALLPVPHVDHLHPDAIIALAAARDGEELTQRCFGDDVAWIPWRRPGFELALQMERLLAARPELQGVVMGGHGLTTWGATSEACQTNSRSLIARAQEFIDREGKPEPLGPTRAGFEPLDVDERAARARALAPTVRGLCSTDRTVVGHLDTSDLVVDFISRERAPQIIPLGTSCPDHFIRTKVRPLLLDLPTSTPLEEQISRLHELHAEYRADYAAYYDRHASDDSPPMRGADPAVVLVPGVGMFTFAADASTARIAGEFFVNAINVMRGAEALSVYEPVPEVEKFRVEYWALEEAKLRRRPKPRPLSGRVAIVTGAASGIGRAIAQRLHAEGACVAIADLDVEGAKAAVDDLHDPDGTMVVRADVADEDAVAEALGQVIERFGGFDIVVNNAGMSISKSLLDTELADWDVQHDVMSRGSFLVSKHASRTMIDQNIGGDIIYIASKNAIVAGPNNVAYGAAKASQAHQVRLLAAELGEHAIRVNGINPDGVVRGSGIFAGGWGAERAKLYGVEEEDLGTFYAERTLLKREVLPEHIGDAASALLCGDLARTTGLLLPVDSGVATAFVR